MNKNIQPIIEGLLFLSGENGITIGELVAILNVDPMEVENNMKKIEKKYQKDDFGIKLIQTAQSYKFCTKPEYGDFFKKYANFQYNDIIPKSCLETLAIIAYNQPITKFNIEEIKGVSPSHTIQILLNRELVQIVGRSEEIGRPNLYGITDKFLDYLGINTLDDLPSLREYKVKDEEQEQSELFTDLDDFKEIRKRLLNELHFEEKVLDLVEDDIEVPAIKLFSDEEPIVFEKRDITEIENDIKKEIADGENSENNS